MYTLHFIDEKDNEVQREWVSCPGPQRENEQTNSLQHKLPQTVPWTGARAVTLGNTIALVPKGRQGLPELPGFLGDYNSGLGKTGSPGTAWAEH